MVLHVTGHGIELYSKFNRAGGRTFGVQKHWGSNSIITIP